MINSVSSPISTPYANTIKGKYFDVGLKQTKENYFDNEEVHESLEGKAGDVNFHLTYNDISGGLTFQTDKGIIGIDKNGYIKYCDTKNENSEPVELKPLDIQA